MKNFECGTCNSVSDEKSWNTCTIDACVDDNIEPIGGEEREHSYYFCPKCGDQVDGDSVYEVAPQ